jgi:hypothetical protein
MCRLSQQKPGKKPEYKTNPLAHCSVGLAFPLRTYWAKRGTKLNGYPAFCFRQFLNNAGISFSDGRIDPILIPNLKMHRITADRVQRGIVRIIRILRFLPRFADDKGDDRPDSKAVAMAVSLVTDACKRIIPGRESIVSAGYW